jgi:hypothetical protein
VIQRNTRGRQPFEQRQRALGTGREHLRARSGVPDPC